MKNKVINGQNIKILNLTPYNEKIIQMKGGDLEMFDGIFNGDYINPVARILLMLGPSLDLYGTREGNEFFAERIVLQPMRK